MPVFKAHLGKGRVSGRIVRVDRGESRSDADVRKNNVQIVRRHDSPDQRFDLCHFRFSDRDATTRWRFDINDEHAGIGTREK